MPKPSQSSSSEYGPFTINLRHERNDKYVHFWIVHVEQLIENGEFVEIIWARRDLGEVRLEDANKFVARIKREYGSHRF